MSAAKAGKMPGETTQTYWTSSSKEGAVCNLAVWARVEGRAACVASFIGDEQFIDAVRRMVPVLIVLLRQDNEAAERLIGGWPSEATSGTFLAWTPDHPVDFE